MQDDTQFKPLLELKQSWFAFRDNWFALCVIYFLRSWLTLLCACITFALLIDFKGWNLVAAGIVAAIIGSILQVPYLKFFKSISQGQKADWSVLNINLKQGLNMLLTQAFVLISIAAGLVLLVVPGLILSVRLLPSAFCVLDDKSPLDSINTSFKLAGGYVFPITIILVVSGIIDYFTGFFALITEFVITIFLYRFYLSRMEAQNK